MQYSFQTHYEELLTILTKSTSRIILMEPFLFPCPAFYQAWLPLRHSMAENIQKLARQFQLPYLTLHQELNEEARKYGYSSITTDGIHLTSQGQKFLADRLYPLLLSFDI